MTIDELKDRVLQYDMLELPGQPMGMHMGTSYLVHDLLRHAEQLQRERDEAVNQAITDDQLKAMLGWASACVKDHGWVDVEYGVKLFRNGQALALIGGGQDE